MRSSVSEISAITQLVARASPTLIATNFTHSARRTRPGLGRHPQRAVIYRLTSAYAPR